VPLRTRKLGSRILLQPCEGRGLLAGANANFCTGATYIRTGTADLCTSTAYLCTSTAYHCTGTAYLCTSTAYLGTSTAYLCTSTAYLCTDNTWSYAFFRNHGSDHYQQRVRGWGCVLPRTGRTQKCLP